MTWQGILSIVITSSLLGIASLWLDHHLFADIAKCEKCGHDSRNCEEKK